MATKKTPPKKSAPAKKAPVKKLPVKPPAKKPVIEPEPELPPPTPPPDIFVDTEPEAPAADPNAAILEKYPQLTEGDLFMYGGEERSSMLSRLATKLGIPAEELN